MTTRDKRVRGTVATARLAAPARLPLDRVSDVQLGFVLSEYSAVCGVVQSAQTNQIAVLSFGAAGAGLIFAAASALWDQQAELTAVLFFAGVPLITFLTLAVYSGELLRLMRASYFLNQLEFAVNQLPLSGEADAAPAEPPVVGHLLCWEQWSHVRRGDIDVDRLSDTINRICIYAVFVLLALGSASAGFVRLHGEPHREVWAYVGLAAGLLIGAASLLWSGSLVRRAYRYRLLYDYNADFPPGGRPSASERQAVRLLHPGPPNLTWRPSQK